MLAIDELPLLINRILKGSDHQMNRRRIDAAEEFLSWLRRNAQKHRDRITMVVSGSVGIMPIVEQAGLSASLNVFSAMELQPWSRSTASECLKELARTYGVRLPAEIRAVMCRRLRSCVPHHVQQFFDAIHRRLGIACRGTATLQAAEDAYREDMLGTRGRIAMAHYDEKLELVLGPRGYRVARKLLGRAASARFLSPASISESEWAPSVPGESGSGPNSFVLNPLEHDGYLQRESNGYRFASGLLEDWYRARMNLPYEPFPLASE